MPTLLTRGGESPPMFASVVAKVAGALPRAEVVEFPEAGHVPHVTHPEAYAAAVVDFTLRHAA